jgi:hypothetical protein
MRRVPGHSLFFQLFGKEKVPVPHMATEQHLSMLPGKINWCR